MPNARWNKLAPAKQARILDAAARAFAPTRSAISAATLQATVMKQASVTMPSPMFVRFSHIV